MFDLVAMSSQSLALSSHFSPITTLVSTQVWVG